MFEIYEPENDTCLYVRRKKFAKKGLFAYSPHRDIGITFRCTEINEDITPESTGFWNKYFVYPMSWFITYFADLFDGNYGLALVIVTVIVRVVLLPLNVKQIKSSKAMQDIQPELKEIQKKYSSKDANTQQKLQQETMALFQKHGVNPLAGCLPIFVQMPVLIA